MDLNPFSNFFGIAATLCFAFAGSKSFRAAVNETILKINDSLDAITQDLEVESSKFTVVELEADAVDDPKSKHHSLLDRAKLVDLATYSERLELLQQEEARFRQFPTGLKSSFLMTGLFCIAVILLAGFSQFFDCTEKTLVILAFLDLALVYNVIVFVRSHFQSRCSNNTKSIWPVILICSLCAIGALYAISMSWIARRCVASPEFQIAAQAIRVPPTIHVDGRWVLCVALFTSVSPFLLHFVRVQWHKTRYKRKFAKLRQEFAAATHITDRAEQIIKEKLAHHVSRESNSAPSTSEQPTEKTNT